MRNKPLIGRGIFEHLGLSGFVILNTTLNPKKLPVHSHVHEDREQKEENSLARMLQTLIPHTTLYQRARDAAPPSRPKTSDNHATQEAKAGSANKNMQVTVIVLEIAQGSLGCEVGARVLSPSHPVACFAQNGHCGSNMWAAPCKWHVVSFGLVACTGSQKKANLSAPLSRKNPKDLGAYNYNLFQGLRLVRCLPDGILMGFVTKTMQASTAK